MTWVERGRIRGDAIVLTKPLPLPEGTEVAVRIEAVTPADDRPAAAGNGDFTSLAFFGMWSDRQDMADSAGWVRQQRDQWQQRIRRQD